MSDFGTIVLDRGVFGHAALRDDQPYPEILAWIWMLAAAAKSQRSRRINGQVVQLNRGQLAYSHRYLAKQFKWSVSRVQRFLEHLTVEAMITVAESSVTCVTIINYEKWQHATTTSVAGSVTESGSSQVRISKNANSDGHNRAGPPQLDGENESGLSQICKTPSTDSESINGGGTRARESVGYVTAEAIELADELMLMLGIDPTMIPPGWYGMPMWLQAGLKSGWQPPIVRVAVAKVCARRGFGLPHSFKYLGPPIAREHTLAASPPLPMPPVIASTTQGESNAQKTAASRDWKGARDDFRAARAELSAAIDGTADSSGQGGRSVVRLVAPAGRGRR